MQDSQIVTLYFERNEKALKATEAKYGKYLLKVAYNILADISDSEESVNDTYLAAWNSIPPNKPQVLSTYLGKLTRRISIDIFRKRNSQKRQGTEYALSLAELEDCLKSPSNLEDSAELKAVGNAISRFLYTLPKKTRALFVFRYYFADSLKDAAKHAGITESKAKSLLYRTRLQLKEFLLKEGYEI